MEQNSRTLERIGELGLIAVVRGESRAAAIEVAAALIEGGVEGIEISFTTPEAHRVMEDLRGEYGDRILLGAGTVTASDQAEDSVAAGAVFLSSPGCDPDLLSFMERDGLTIIPGVLTPSEVMLAHQLGAQAVKLFPEPPKGHSYLESLREAFPEMLFLPTEGVSPENVGDWFAAGALAVSIGRALAPPALRDDRERTEVTARAKRFVEAVRDAMSRT